MQLPMFTEAMCTYFSRKDNIMKSCHMHQKPAKTENVLIQ